MGVGTLFSTLIGGITSYYAGKDLSKQATAKKNAMIRNIETLQRRIEEEGLSLEEALKRIDDFIDTQSAETRVIMEKQVERASGQLQKQYQQGLESMYGDLREQLGQRRLRGSGVGVEAARKGAGTLLSETQEKEVNLREEAMSRIASEINRLKQGGFGLKEGKRERFADFKNSGLNQIMMLENMRDAFGSQAERSGFLDFFSGAAKGGLGALVGEFFTPGDPLKETPTDRSEASPFGKIITGFKSLWQ